MLQTKKIVFLVRPPEVYKTWANLLQDKNIETVKAYIKKFQKEFAVGSDGCLSVLESKVNAFFGDI